MVSVPSKADRRRIVARIEALGLDPRPRGCVRLSRADFYRVRQGRYRIIYEVRDEELVVLVIEVGDRNDVYR